MTEKPESKARKEIDRLLSAAGWVIQDYKHINLGVAGGVAVREFPLQHGFADYLLFIDRKAVGVVEAKSEGTTLSGVADQTKEYLSSVPAAIPKVSTALPFAYESTGIGTYFRDSRDPDPRSRKIFAFHRPDTLAQWLHEQETLRTRLRNLPPLIASDLRDCQEIAIGNLEKSFAEDRPRALIQMASGSGKTYTAVYTACQLIKFGNARRILFLVDRTNLGIQTKGEFYRFVTPDDGRKFTELYSVQHLTANQLDSVSRVCITTIQRLYSMLKGEKEFDASLEEASLFEMDSTLPSEPKEVGYNPQLPIETFDFIITDECHRSIYNLWSQVLEYFDSFLIGLTATPSKQTLGFFNQNLVMMYSQEEAIAAGVNVGYEIYRIKTEITEGGSKVEAGFFVSKRDKLSRKRRWEQLDEPLEYSSTELDRSVVSQDQIRTVIQTFKQRLFTEIFPGRNEVPKTLVFAKDDSHAEDIVQIIREEFGKGNEFCKKITYRTYGQTGEKPENLVKSFCNSYNPRIAVTVDMISTGTDVKPLECLLFMRDVKSRVFFEQMKGRGSRTIPDTDIEAVTPDTRHKTHYVIVDAVGVCEHDKTDSKPLEYKRSIPFDKLILSIALGQRDEYSISSIAGRLAKLQLEISDNDRAAITKLAGSKLENLTANLLDSIDPDVCIQRAKSLFSTENPTDEQAASAQKELVTQSCIPFDNPQLRQLLIDLKRKSEQTVDVISKDVVLLAGYSEEAQERARAIVIDFKKFIESNKNELLALQIIFSRNYKQRKITYEAIKELANALEKPPHNATPQVLWEAYERLDKSKVQRAGPLKLLSNMISLVRFTIGQDSILEPFSTIVDRRFQKWLSAQEGSGRTFSPLQHEWLKMIKDHIAASLSIDMDDLELSPFYEKGGPLKFYEMFGKDSDSILNDLPSALVASNGAD
jgi:type I restriction enzyme R subunit